MNEDQTIAPRPGARQILGALLFLITAAVPLDAALKPEEVPSFTLRARVVSLAGKEPLGKQFRFNVANVPASSEGTEWSGPMMFGRPQIEAVLKGYPAIYMGGWPVVAGIQVSPVEDPTEVEAEARFVEGGEPVKLTGRLFGPSLGLIVWRDDAKQPHLATMADYNHRYWKVLKGVQVPAGQRPKRFPIVDRFIGGDSDRLDWEEGIGQLARAGFSALMLPPGKVYRDMLLKVGLKRTAWAVYNPPGYAFDYDAKTTPKDVEEWAQAQAKPYLDSGYSPEDMAIFAMSDEPGWYFPSMFKPVNESPVLLRRFHEYLQAQGLKPAEVGAADWESVRPLGRSQATDLPKRRLFYWTMRFFSWDSSRHFANCTRAMERAFYPGLPVLTNWNFFAGRLYVPGPVANNAEKQNPDAAMGGHDWLEFGRLRGCTMLWTEDWFGDGMAYQWSFYCAKLRCAAEKGGVQFGGYVIPRTAGDRADGILQKILTVVGSGGKAIKYFVFGPEYNFPGNCYSERAQVLPKMAEAHGMVGAAEDLLWPGVRPRPQVALLAPRSAELWDVKDVPIPNQIQDATNTGLNNATVDYMAEVADLYLALQHANLPVDFVEEDDLTRQGLRPYKVLYVTEPNVPVEGQRGIVQWVRAGGTLVTVPGAGGCDRYDEPTSILASLTGVRAPTHQRILVPNLAALQSVGTVEGKLGSCEAIASREKIEHSSGVAFAKFSDDGAPAILSRSVGKGRAVHFATFPGLAYAKSVNGAKDGLPAGFSEAIRRWIVWPTELAEVQPPVTVSQPLIESPLLLSKAGAAVTLLNWTGEPVQYLDVTVRVPFAVKSVVSVKHGVLTPNRTQGGVAFTMPLEAADVVMVRAAAASP